MDLYSPIAPRGEGGAVRHQRGESHRRWLITVVLTMSYDTESKSRNADFISIAAERQSVNPLNPMNREISYLNASCTMEE